MSDKELGTRLAEARNRLGLTQNDVCTQLHIANKQSLSSYETCKTSPPIEVLKDLSVLYKVSLDWLVFGNDHPIQKKKQNLDYVQDLMEAIDHLGLCIDEELDWDNNPTGNYHILIRNSKVDGIEELSKDIFMLSSARGAIDFDDYRTLVQKRIQRHAVYTNNYAEKCQQTEPVKQEFDSISDEGLPF